MRALFNEVVEKGRVRVGPHSSTHGRTGVFKIPYQGKTLTVVASDGMGWDHVSVSLPNRCPKWDEMDYIKKLFWNDNEVVMQLHVASDDHINIHKFCLHLWRPQKQAIPLPPKVMV